MNTVRLGGAMDRIIENGWQAECHAPDIVSDSPSVGPTTRPATRCGRRLMWATIRSTLAQFREHGHHPSRTQQRAVWELVSALVVAAEGGLPPRLYVCALDPGFGKTTALACFIRNLQDQPALASE